MKATRKMLKEIKSCCHHGHGASVFGNGDVMQAISSNDVIATSKVGGGWDYRVAYIDDPDITLTELQRIFDEQESMQYV